MCQAMRRRQRCVTGSGIRCSRYDGTVLYCTVLYVGLPHKGGGTDVFCYRDQCGLRICGFSLESCPLQYLGRVMASPPGTIVIREHVIRVPVRRCADRGGRWGSLPYFHRTSMKLESPHARSQRSDNTHTCQCPGSLSFFGGCRRPSLWRGIFVGYAWIGPFSSRFQRPRC